MCVCVGRQVLEMELELERLQPGNTKKRHQTLSQVEERVGLLKIYIFPTPPLLTIILFDLIGSVGVW